jgi:lysophospholipase L1-like esterase
VLIALALASLALAVTAIEAALRVVGYTRRFETPLSHAWPWLVHDPVVGAKNRPGYQSEHLGFAINSLGFRGKEVARRKRSGVVRVACLGDSTTFGIWQEQLLQRADMSYPEELAGLLKADGLAVEVINAGVLGSTTAHGLRMLLAHLLSLEPDVVTVRYGNNEHIIGVDPTGWERSGVARLLPAGAYGWETVRIGFRVFGRDSLAAGEQMQPRRLSPDQFRQNLTHFVELGRTHGYRVLFLDYPYRPLEQGELPSSFPLSTVRTPEELYALHEEYQVVQRDVARTTNTALLETMPRFRAHPSPVFSDHDLSHPNEAGIRLLASLLREKLIGLGWLGPHRPHQDASIR